MILIENYPDLQDVFGNDYRAVVLHYLTNGIMEGRDGYTLGGGTGDVDNQVPSSDRESHIPQQL